ncbi:MAG: Asr1405/Asl0597 family protein [Cyanobacteria bacterium J06626_14]
MDSNGLDNVSQGWLEVRHHASWEIFVRLQELDVPCSREPYHPLKIHARTPLALVQSWSVFRQFTQSRSELSSWLDRCWMCPGSESCSPLER